MSSIKDGVPRKVDDFPWKEVDGEGIVLDVRSGDYFELDALGLWIWKRLDGKRTVEAIAQEITRRYRVDKGTAMADLVEFLASLRQASLIRLVADEDRQPPRKGKFGGTGK